MFLIGLLCVISVVNGHSILRTPAPWRTRESKRAPCGNGNIPATLTNAAVNAGADIAAMWEVTAGDGNGPVTARYVTTDAEATTAGFNAAPQLAVTMNPIPQRGTGQYPFTFPAPPPGTNCQGGPNNNACHIQFKSTSNWYSCATIPMNAQVAPTGAPTTLSPTRPATTRAPTTQAPTAPVPGQYTCSSLTAAQGTICQGIAGKNVLTETGSTQANVISKANADFSDVRYNPLVFRNGASTACGQALAELFCSFSLPLCTAPSYPSTQYSSFTQSCFSRCETAMAVCDIDPYHKEAYSCAQFTESTSDVYGSCPTIPSRSVYLKNRFVGSQETNYWAPNQQFIDMIIYSGDKLTFKWTNPSTLYKFPNQAAFDACDFSGAQQFGSGATEYEWSTPASVEFQDVSYFGSQPGCLPTNTASTTPIASQKLKVTVIETPMGATVVPIPAGVPPQTISGNPPTAGPGGFLGDYGNNPSRASMVSVSWMIMSCLVLFML